jgi:hypothetical protein
MHELVVTRRVGKKEKKPKPSENCDGFVKASFSIADIFVYPLTYVYQTRVARFYFAQRTKAGELYQITRKYLKWPENIPNGHIIDQMAVR